MRGNPVTIKNFVGHKPSTNNGEIPDNGFVLLENFWVTRSGTLRARVGYRREAGTQTYQQGTLLGQWKTVAGIEKLIASDANGVHAVSWDGGSHALVNANPASLLLQQDTRAYLFHTSGNIRTWNGTTHTDTGISQQATVGTQHKFRFFICNNQASGTPRSQLTYSSIFDLAAPNTAAAWPGGGGGGTIDINSSDADFITAVVVMNDVLFVFKRFSTWAVYVEGSPPWTVRNLHPTIGCVGRDTAVAIGGLIYFRSAFGVYRTDGTTFEEISGDVKEIFDNQPSFTPTEVNKRSAAWFGDYYIINDGYGKNWQVYNIENGAWSTFSTTAYTGISRILTLVEFSPPRLSFIEYESTNVGRLNKFEELNGYKDKDGTVDVPLKMYTKFYDFDNPSSFKMIREINLDIDTPDGNNQSLTGWLYNDYNSSAVHIQAVPGPSRRRLWRFRGPQRCRVCKFELDGAIVQDIEINSITFDMGLVGRVGDAR